MDSRFECRCGFRQPSSSYPLVNDTNCNIKCPGEQSKTCGGKNHIQVYRTTVQNTGIKFDIITVKYVVQLKFQVSLNPRLL